MPRPPGSRRTDYLARRGDRLTAQTGSLVIEEPLEIRLDGAPIAVTMRTPGHDIELALGFLFTETVLEDAGVVVSISHCEQSENVVDVRTEPGAAGVHPPAPRSFYASSSCGVCGKASIEAVRVKARSVADDPLRVSPKQLAGLTAKLRERQPLFRETGALHAAALFSADGELLCVREDVGRHNAVDKLVGQALLDERVPLRGHLMLVSGRLGFEIAQKALVAGIPLVAAISGPSSLAVDLAAESGMTLIGFLRDEELNVYCGAQRISD